MEAGKIRKGVIGWLGSSICDSNWNKGLGLFESGLEVLTPESFQKE